MIRSMFAAVSGLRNHQTMMDVVGNNIANVNTAGFKSSSTVFEDVLSQTLRGSGRPTAAAGGTNPAQIGLGSRVAGVSTNFAQGSLQLTNRSTDFAIQGDGFFVVNQGGSQLYTRAGSFSPDSMGRLVTQSGALLQGWTADPTGAVNANGPVTNIKIPVGDVIAPRQSQNISIGGNLPANAAAGAVITNSVEVFDKKGNSVTVRFEFTKQATVAPAPDAWQVSYFRSDDPVAMGTSTLEFGLDGELTAASGTTLTIPAASLPTFDGSDITVNLGSVGETNRVTQYGELSTLAVTGQDGNAAGTLQSFTVGQDGTIVGAYSNGSNRVLGQVAVATFANPEGLLKAGGSTYRDSINSGFAQIGGAGNGGRGLLLAGTLEMSNVDLASEFTNLIIAQRGFQSNSRVVTTSDEILQEVVNLKR